MNALMIPIHPPKINWLYNLLCSIDRAKLSSAQLNYNIVLLLSNDYEKIKIVRAISTILPEYLPLFKFVNVESIIKDKFQDTEVLTRYQQNTDLCIVNVKKFCGLYWGMEKYSYIAVIDCDTIFKDSSSVNNFFQNLTTNYYTRKYFGAKTPDEGLGKILKQSTLGFTPQDINKLEEITENFSIYPWFFDIPFYQSGDLKDFFSYMLDEQKGNQFWLGQNWWTFEHIMFIYYCCLYKNAKLINYAEYLLLPPPEGLSLRDLQYIKYHYDYMPTWTRFYSIIDDDIEILTGENIHMLYHVDRT